MFIIKKLLDIVVCPVCHGKLFINSEENQLICKIDNIFFAIENGIPNLLKKKN